MVNYPVLDVPESGNEAPNFETAKVRSGSNKAQQRSKNDYQNVQFNNKVSIFGSLPEFTNAVVAKVYEMKYSKELDQARASYGALDKAVTVVSNAMNGMPTTMQNATVLTALANYLVDHTLPPIGTTNVASDLLFQRAVQAWGDILEKNAETLEKDKMTFSKTISGGTNLPCGLDGVVVKSVKPMLIKNPDEKVIKAIELVEGKEIAPQPNVKAPN